MENSYDQGKLDLSSSMQMNLPNAISKSFRGPSAPKAGPPDEIFTMRS